MRALLQELGEGGEPTRQQRPVRAHEFVPKPRLTLARCGEGLGGFPDLHRRGLGRGASAENLGAAGRVGGGQPAHQVQLGAVGLNAIEQRGVQMQLVAQLADLRLQHRDRAEPMVQPQRRLVLGGGGELLDELELAVEPMQRRQQLPLVQLLLLLEAVEIFDQLRLCRSGQLTVDEPSHNGRVIADEAGVLMLLGLHGRGRVEARGHIRRPAVDGRILGSLDASLQVSPLDGKLSGLRHEVVGVVLALLEPSAQTILAARVEERGLPPALQRTNRLVQLHAPQRLHVRVKRLGEVCLLRDQLRVPRLELAVPLGELVGKVAQVGDGRTLGGALNLQLGEQPLARRDAGLACLDEGARMHMVQQEVSLVVEESVDERRGVEERSHVGRDEAVLRSWQLSCEFNVERMHRLTLGWQCSFRESPSPKQEHRARARVCDRKAILSKRSILLEFDALKQ